MHAVVIAEPGGPEVLRWTEVPDPSPAPDEVVVQVAASAVNRADLLQRQGRYPAPEGAPPWPGLECSGTVIEVGPEVVRWSVGDRVCALLAGGGYAQRTAIPQGQVLPVPSEVGLIEAAALPEVACTVWSNLVLRADLSSDEVLLVHGGASGIGTHAIQVGRALGATVAVTAGSPDKLARCSELGAQVLIDYRRQDFVAEILAATDGRGADVILDNMGAKYLQRNVTALAPNGRLVVIGLQGGTRAELDLGALMARRGSVHGTLLRARPAAEKAHIVAAVEAGLWPMVAAGRVRPVIDRVVPMVDAALAHRAVEEGAHVGKVLLTAPGLAEPGT